ncbi:hypothetical protein HPB48_019821 [Haemaphysalis longicornis]|uniref:Uncharacterized protein n=1 Tax=Haemaphysalis longicornis TaxID=44386 RepID=A0A9J6GGW4_HAELO|nr:hypothetical protein HPB48_019821 [Haemaphysalis longicornis]
MAALPTLKSTKKSRKTVEQARSMKRNSEKLLHPLLKWLYELRVKVRDLLNHFYFDNLFTILHLLGHLKEKSYEATGTVSENHVPKECPIAWPDIIKCKTRGYEEHALFG